MKDQINFQVLCVLKKHNSRVEVDYETIENKLPAELGKLYSMCDDDTDPTLIINFINDTPELQKMLGRFNYCCSLKGAYEGWDNINSRIQEYFKDAVDFSDQNEYNEFIKNKKDNLKNKFKERELAYNIELAYKKSSSNESIIAYSHREIGWTTKHKLSNNFQIEFKTNFGYGRASYFYTRLKYKEIDIIPFSEWVTYQKPQYDTLVQYSRKHNVNHESWCEAMTYVYEAYNMSIEDENAFISKYLIEECEGMTKGLESMVPSIDNLQFKEINGDHPHGSYIGHQQVEIKGERISGALKFIQSIMTYEKVVHVREFVSRIEKCNSDLQPLLVSSMKLISHELTPLETEFAIIHSKYNEMHKLYEYYSETKKTVKASMEKQDDYSSAKFELEFSKQFPDFKKFREQFDHYMINIYSPSKSKIENLRSTMKKIKNYNITIEKYFNDREVIS